jgi:hypothetical protein
MEGSIDRRDFLSLLGVGGVVFASGLAPARAERRTDFSFVQLSDTHLGYSGPANPEASTTLERAVLAINRSGVAPDFVVFTGDLTHTTDDPSERRARLARFLALADRLDTKTRVFLAGEHDAALDRGKAFLELIGPLHRSFDHQGFHFVALDNVSDPSARLGEAQLDWLHRDLSGLDPHAPVVVFAHRPLFPLAPEWDWSTPDGDKAIDILSHRSEVTVFYGHIHQEHHHQTGGIRHHAARSLIFPLPAPGSVPKKAPVPWNPEHPGHGLGWRDVLAAPRGRPAQAAGSGVARIGRIEEHDLGGATP